MWNLLVDDRGVRIRRAPKNGLRVLGMLLLIFGALWIIGGLTGGLPFLVVIGVASVVGGAFLVRAGSDEARGITALLSAQDVTGGTLVHVIDEKNQVHQFVTDGATVGALTAQLAT